MFQLSNLTTCLVFLLINKSAWYQKISINNNYCCCYIIFLKSQVYARYYPECSDMVPLLISWVMARNEIEICFSLDRKTNIKLPFKMHTTFWNAVLHPHVYKNVYIRRKCGWKCIFKWKHGKLLAKFIYKNAYKMYILE